jgi:hypothetical protein
MPLRCETRPAAGAVAVNPTYRRIFHGLGLAVTAAPSGSWLLAFASQSSLTTALQSATSLHVLLTPSDQTIVL